MNAWSELPNAKHIDWALESIRSNYDIWIQARYQTYNQAWFQAYEQARIQAREQARNKVYNQARNQVRDQVRYKALEQALGVLLALVAYDDCDQYLSMTYSELKTWAVLTEKPQAMLLLTMKWIQENECLV